MRNNTYTKLYEALLNEAPRGKRKPPRDPNPGGGKGIPRHGLGTPSKLERKLGVYVRSASDDQPNIGAGVGGQSPHHTSVKRHRGEPKKEGGFTRIRHEDMEPYEPSVRAALVRVRKRRGGGKLTGGGTRKLKRKLQSSYFNSGEKGNILAVLNKKLAAGRAKWKADISDSVQGTLPFPKKKTDAAKKRIKASLDTIRKQGKLSLLFKGFSKQEPVRTEK